jgi:hypothetical protein
MNGLVSTLALALTAHLLLIAVLFGAWHVSMGHKERARQRILRGYVILGGWGGLLLLMMWPNIAYLWTESLWFAHFVRADGSPAHYDAVFWRMLGIHWKIFVKFALGATCFIVANVLVATRVCRIREDYATWTRLHTRLIHRLLVVAAFVVSSVLALVVMGEWEVFASYGAYRKGIGKVPATVQFNGATGGEAGHDLSPRDHESVFQTDIARFEQYLRSTLEPKIARIEHVEFYSGMPTTGHRPPKPHYYIKGYLYPIDYDAKRNPTRYRVGIECTGPTVLERVAREPGEPESEAKRRIRTGENYRKSKVFETDVDRSDIPLAVESLTGYLLDSKYLRNGFVDPIFHKNIGYFLFEYPALWLTSLWVKAVVGIAFGFIAYQYRFYYHRDAHSMTPAVAGVTVQGTALWILMLGVSIWRSHLVSEGLLYARPNLIKSGRVPFGVSYVDVVQIEMYRVYAMVLVALMALLALNMILRSRKIWVGVGISWVASYIVLIWGYPAVVYQVRVRPNPLRTERVFVQNHIALTRQAFNLESIESGRVIKKLAQFEDIVAHPEVLKNVQMWDRRVMWERLQQSHTVQRYYEFHRDPDIDRYEINGELRQVIIAGREINPDRLPTKEWFSRRLKYTHGYGVVLAPVNEAEEPGVPRFWVKGIPMKVSDGEGFSSLRVSQPRIYYGEQTKEYCIVGTEELEYDYPVESDFTTTTYEGHGGVELGGGLRRLAFASRLNEPVRVAISSALRPTSRVMLHRDISDRIRRIAPFLEFDPDPFLVIGKDTGRLWWIVDAYTVSNRYPYAQSFRPLDPNGKPIEDLGGDFFTEPDLKRFNYIRNAAVAVVDPYNGDVFLYVTDPTDPLMQVYMSLFPELFLPIEDLPDEIRTHLRYPDYLTWVQASVYALYHVNDPVIFLTGGDAWKLPRELFHSNALTPMMPYYSVLTLPGANEPEFVTILPFSPPATTKRLTAWLVSRSDREHYGDVRCYALSRAEEVDGPEQIENRIDQDTELSGQFTLLGAAGSEVIRGNLLLLPVRTRSGEDALFYTEPVYLRATAEQGQSMPELKFVVVIADDKLAADATFEKSLRKVFKIGETVVSTGFVRDDHGAPIAGAALSVALQSGGTLANTAVSEPNGSYRLENIPPGNHRLRVAREGYIPSEVAITAQLGFPLDANVVLKKAPAPPPPPKRTVADIARSANAALQQYLKSTGEGKLMDAARALEQLKNELDALNRATQPAGKT